MESKLIELQEYPHRILDLIRQRPVEEILVREKLFLAAFQLEKKGAQDAEERKYLAELRYAIGAFPKRLSRSGGKSGESAPFGTVPFFIAYKCCCRIVRYRKMTSAAIYQIGAYTSQTSKYEICQFLELENLLAKFSICVGPDIEPAIIKTSLGIDVLEVF